MTRIRIRVFFATVLLGAFLGAFLAALTGAPGQAAARGMSLIRDAETESIIRSYVTPLLLAANLDPDAVTITLIRDNTLNAFVAGGQHIFINTGLLEKAESPEQLIGVLAHEIGHIAHGDISRTPDAMENATAYTILGAILGGAAAVAGRPDVGAAVLAGGHQAAVRNFLSFTRGQEAAADQAAVRLLDRTHQSARGLLDFMKKLEGQELLSVRLQDPYMQTHPVTENRIEFLAQHVAHSPYSNNKAPPAVQAAYHRMRVKLTAFLQPVSRVLSTYGPDDKTQIGRYARAIALYRKPDTAAALKIMNGLIAEAPNDPYFHELKGQILFESGHPKEAIPSYEAAVRLAPKSWQIIRDLARAQIESGDDTLLEPAIANLKVSLRRESDRAFTWRQLAVAYGRLKRMGETSHALAEEAYLQHRYREAIGLAERAVKMLPNGSPDWLAAQDVLSAAQQAKQRQEKRR